MKKQDGCTTVIELFVWFFVNALAATYVTWLGWLWHVVPLGAPTLTFTQVLALTITFRFTFPFARTWEDPPQTEKWRAKLAGQSIGIALVCLLLWALR